MPSPSLAEVTTYLGSSSSSQAEITTALAAEKAAQARVCRVPADTATWPADLAEALLRRVARNLYVRGLPSGAETNFGGDGTAATVRVGADPEVRRLEAPFRKWVVA